MRRDDAISGERARKRKKAAAYGSRVISIAVSGNDRILLQPAGRGSQEGGEEAGAEAESEKGRKEKKEEEENDDEAAREKQRAERERERGTDAKRRDAAIVQPNSRIPRANFFFLKSASMRQQIILKTETRL